MKYLLHILLFVAVPAMVKAQVEVYKKIQATGEADQRGVDGITDPTMPSSAITVEGSLLGGAHWCEASNTGQNISLEQPIAVENYRPGMLLRFIWPADMHGAITLQHSGLDALPLLRPDGLEPVPGQLPAGTVAEVVNAVDRWVLLSPAERGCPPGSLPVHAGLCMDQDSGPDVYIYEAMDQCQAKGGKLCTWDEYYLGCTVLAGQLLNNFVAWEWMDDTSNHTHTADQAGRTTCRSQRSRNPVVNQARVRCCYRPR